MIKRPLAEQFHQKVLDGIKISTIRPNPWPVGVPIGNQRRFRVHAQTSRDYFANELP
jgi:hypothetical protein